MKITQATKFILLFSSLGGLIYFSLLVYQSGLSNINLSLKTGTFLQSSTWLALAWISCLTMFIISIWKLTRSTHSEIHTKYNSIDSESLDANANLCMDFYDLAYTYRRKNGAQKYKKHIVNHFHFFYDFHNYALQWIDEIVSRTKSDNPPSQFIVSAINSGHIGHVFTDIIYEGGINNSGIKPGSKLLAYSKADCVELWSPDSSIPICTLSNKFLELKRAKKQQDSVTGILKAEIKQNQHPISIKLSFPEYQFDLNKNKFRRHEIYATKNYQRFQEWLDQLDVKLLTSQQSNFGISVSDGNNSNYGIDVDYGIPAQDLIKTNQIKLQSIKITLSSLKGRKIDAFFDRKTMPLVKNKSPLDAVVLCSNLGLVTVTENTTSGNISYNSDAGWIVYKNNRSKIIPNTCLEALRAKKSLSSLLKSHNLLNWPIHSLVVFTDKNVELNQTIGKKRLQCDVIKLDELEQWFITNSNTPQIRFTKDDYNTLALLFNKKLGQYREKAKTQA